MAVPRAVTLPDSRQLHFSETLGVLLPGRTCYEVSASNCRDLCHQVLAYRTRNWGHFKEDKNSLQEQDSRLILKEKLNSLAWERTGCQPGQMIFEVLSVQILYRDLPWAGLWSPKSLCRSASHSHAREGTSGWSSLGPTPVTGKGRNGVERGFLERYWGALPKKGMNVVQAKIHLLPPSREFHRPIYTRTSRIVQHLGSQFSSYARTF